MFIVNNKKKTKTKTKRKKRKRKEKERQVMCACVQLGYCVVWPSPRFNLRHFYMYIVKATLKFQTAVGYNFIMLCNRIIIIIRHAKNAVLPLFEISLGRVRQEIPLSQN